MKHGLDFSHRHSYTGEPAIAIPITLVSDVATQIDFSVNLDTGSTYCIFEKKYADWLELDLTSGTPTRISTATGSFYCYGHELTLVDCSKNNVKNAGAATRIFTADLEPNL